MKVESEPGTATPVEVQLEKELVHVALRAAEHHPILKAVYAGPPEWLEEARHEPGDIAAVAEEAAELAQRARGSGNPYVAGQARSVAAQLELKLGRSAPYDRMVGELLGVELVPPTPDELEALRADVSALASTLAPGTAAGAVERWESARLISGEAKWDAAIEEYRAGRAYAFGGSFPLRIDEDLELVRITDELSSVNLSWYPPERMTFGVNVSTPRTPATVAFEVAHNIYPGDYLHLATLQQHTYRKCGHVAASIKLKNAPESVISEGIEETAYLRLHPDASAEQLLACKLEWLRRMATLRGAIAIQVEGRPENEVVRTMSRDGFMDHSRTQFQLRLIKHPLWGPYQYTYILGRRLVEEGDRRASTAGAEKQFLEYLYGGLHTPATFLPALDVLLSA